MKNIISIAVSILLPVVAAAACHASLRDSATPMGPSPAAPPVGRVSQSPTARTLETDPDHLDVWLTHVGQSEYSDDTHPTVLLTASALTDLAKTPPHFIGQATLSRAQALAIIDGLDNDGILANAQPHPPGVSSPWSRMSVTCYVLSLGTPTVGRFDLLLDARSTLDRVEHLRQIVDGDARTLLDRVRSGLDRPMQCE